MPQVTSGVRKTAQPPKKKGKKQTGSEQWAGALREWRRNRRTRTRRELQLYGLAVLGFLAFLWYIQHSGA